jgi:UDP-2-acetamido-2,6-beta-L-arabino-hexul-4-ose reductase
MKNEVKKLDLPELHQGDRGWVMNPISAAGAVNLSPAAMHLVSIRPGASRGNHLHRNATEWILMFGGPGKLAWRCPEGGNIREFVIQGGGPELFQVPPRVEHIITNTSMEDIYALVFYDHDSPETDPGADLTKI